MSNRRSVKPKLNIRVDVPAIGKASLDYSKKSRKSKAASSTSPPTALGRRSKGVAPTVRTTRDTETVSGSGVYINIQNVGDAGDVGLSGPINPGLENLFPWLATNASLFSKYRFNKLVFKFVSRLPTITIGDIILIGDPNVQNVLPQTFSSAVSYQNSVYGNIWLSHTFDGSMYCNKELYIRRGQLEPGQDSKTYDAGSFGYIISGYSSLVASSPPGYITVEYDVTFFDRILPQPLGCSIYQGVYDGTTEERVSIFSGPNVNPLIQTNISESTGNTYIGFPKGDWLMSIVTVPNYGDALFDSAVTTLMSFNSNDYDEVNLIDLTMIPGGGAPGTEGEMRGGAILPIVGAPLFNGVSAAYYVFQVVDSAVPLVYDIGTGTVPTGWFGIEPRPVHTVSGLLPYIITICRISPHYLSVLGLSDTTPILASTAKSEFRVLGKKSKKTRVYPLNLKTSEKSDK